MTDTALKNARFELGKLRDERTQIDQTISRLTDERADLDAKIAKAASFIQAWHEYAGDEVPLLDAGSASDPDTISSRPPKITDNPKKEIVAQTALELISERGVPIARPELHNLLKDKGFDVRGADPLVTLSTMLWRMRDKIIHLQGFGYWDPNKSYAPANYYREGETPTFTGGL